MWKARLSATAQAMPRSTARHRRPSPTSPSPSRPSILDFYIYFRCPQIRRLSIVVGGSFHSIKSCCPGSCQRAFRAVRKLTTLFPTSSFCPGMSTDFSGFFSLPLRTFIYVLPLFIFFSVHEEGTSYVNKWRQRWTATGLGDCPLDDRYS